MKELLEVPLDGAPYGYTPFCDSRKEMDGFRYSNMVTAYHFRCNISDMLSSQEDVFPPRIQHN